MVFVYFDCKVSYLWNRSDGLFEWMGKQQFSSKKKHKQKRKIIKLPFQFLGWRNKIFFFFDLIFGAIIIFSFTQKSKELGNLFHIILIFSKFLLSDLAKRTKFRRRKKTDKKIVYTWRFRLSELFLLEIQYFYSKTYNFFRLSALVNYFFAFESF